MVPGNTVKHFQFNNTGLWISASHDLATKADSRENVVGRNVLRYKHSHIDNGAKCVGYVMCSRLIIARLIAASRW
jgi:hypothetical protein